MPPISVTLSGESLGDIAKGAAALAAALATTPVSPSQDAAPAPAAPKAEKAAKPPKAPKAEAPAAEPAAAPAAAPKAAPAAAAGPTKDAVVAALVKVINASDALGKDGKRICTDLCQKFGGKNASTVPEASYADLIKACQDTIDSYNEDPTA